MRALFTCYPGLGHLHPLVPLARALLDAGHEVAFAAPDHFAQFVRRAGFHAFSAGESRQPAEIFPELDLLTGRERQLFVRIRLFPDAMASRMASDVLALAATWRPDVVVRDALEFGGCIAAEVLGIPHAAVEVNAAGMLLPLVRVMVEPLNLLRAAHGLKLDPELAMLDRFLTLSQFPPSLRSLEAGQPRTLHHLRPSPFDQSGDEGLPAWVDQLPHDQTVYVTLGTTPDFNERPGIFEAIIEGLRLERLNVILTIGRNQDPARFGHVPETIHVTQYIPQTMLLSRCSAVICHGGSGTLTAAIVQGLPMVILPIAADQLENGERCASAGFARVVAQSTLSPQSIREAVLDVIKAPAYRVSAERARDECAALPEITRGVRLLEQLVMSKAPVLASE